MITTARPGTRVRFTFHNDPRMTDYGTVQGPSDLSASRVRVLWDSTGRVTHCTRDTLTEITHDQQQ